LTRQNGAASFAAGAEIVTLIDACPAVVVYDVRELETLVIKSLLRQLNATSDTDATIIAIWILLQTRIAKQTPTGQRRRLVAPTDSRNVLRVVIRRLVLILAESLNSILLQSLTLLFNTLNAI